MNEQEHALRCRFTAYMEKVIKHAKIDYIRKQAYKNKEVYMDDIDEAAVSYMPAWCAPSFESDLYEFEEQKLSDTLRSLPLLRRQILLLSVIEGWPAEDIAKKYKCSVEYVYKQKHFALKKLRESITDGGDSNGC